MAAFRSTGCSTACRPRPAPIAAARDEEYVVAALLHDIGDTLGSYNHPDIAAAILKPFVDEKLHWMVEHHGIFQGYYFFHYLGMDRDMRDNFRGHTHFEDTARFCEIYDQNAFDSGPTIAPRWSISSRWSAGCSRHRSARSTLVLPNPADEGLISR